MSFVGLLQQLKAISLICTSYTWDHDVAKPEKQEPPQGPANPFIILQVCRVRASTPGPRKPWDVVPSGDPSCIPLLSSLWFLH